jgi:hypothetical protein
MDFSELLKTVDPVQKTVLNVLLTIIALNVPEIYGLKNLQVVMIVLIQLKPQALVPHVNLKMLVTPVNVPKKMEKLELVPNVNLPVMKIVRSVRKMELIFVQNVLLDINLIQKLKNVKNVPKTIAIIVMMILKNVKPVKLLTMVKMMHAKLVLSSGNVLNVIKMAV